MVFGDGAVPHYRKRRCHVCGDKIIPQAFCPSCGHLLCGECRRSLTSATPIHGVPDTVPEAEDFATNEDVAPSSRRQSAAVTPASIHVSVPVAVNEVEKFEGANLISHAVKKGPVDPRGAEQVPERPSVAPGVKRNSLVSNSCLFNFPSVTI